MPFFRFSLNKILMYLVKHEVYFCYFKVKLHLNISKIFCVHAFRGFHAFQYLFIDL